MKYYLVGKKLSHSFSAEIHKKNGFDYELKEISENELQPFIKKGDYDGLNITIPYKKKAVSCLDYISFEVKKTGSVNTVVNDCKILKGYNTDIIGMDFAFKSRRVSLKNKNVLILGTGGAGEVAKYLAQKSKAKRVDVVSRTGEINYNNVYIKCAETDIIINATPVGMFPKIKAQPIDLKKFNNVSFVFDVIYNPLRTKLIRQAEELKIKSLGGLSMLVAQAIASENLWRKKDSKLSDKDAIQIKKQTLDIYFKKSNLVLVGMPAAGKSTIGKIVAQKLFRPFIDTDELIEKDTGLTPKDIILRFGEKEFRRIEKKAIEKASKAVGAVIVTGGGAVIEKSNINLLKGNGIVIYLKRDIALLSCKDRPLSAQKSIEKLYKERNKFYKNAKDCEVCNDKEAEKVASEVIKAYENTCYKRC